jgi:hypothetical protein
VRSNSINIINDAVVKYFKNNPRAESAKPKELMPLLIESGLFEKDHRNGLPLRNILRELDDLNQLDLIPSLLAERKKVNVSWFFLRPGEQKPKNIQSEKKLQKRKDSDEAYIIDLCDEILGISASRQHNFDFLRGDIGKKSKGDYLPVDSYYSSINLVVEFREKQHTEAVKHFDKPNIMTVSGVNRGEQRKIYDQRRRDILPENGIKLVEISYADFNYDSKKKIKRNKNIDLEIVKNILVENNVI